MTTRKSDIEKILLSNEELLLKNEIRTDPAAISPLVQDGCVEVTEQGARHAYQSGKAFGTNDGVLYIIDKTAQVVDLADDCKLLLYSAARVKKDTRTKAHCSSVWKMIGDAWKVVYHQRTITAE